MPLDVRPLTSDRWADLQELFGPSGGYSGCWCTWWRVSAREFDAGCRDGAAGNRERLRRLTYAGRVPGLLAYDVPAGPAGGAPGGDVEAAARPAPVGWVSVAPRPEFGRILRSPTLRPDRPDRPDARTRGSPAQVRSDARTGGGPAQLGADDRGDPSVWSVVCFWLPRRHRGRGIGTALLDAAVDHAGAGGARLVEGYPVDTAGGRRPAAELYTGTVGMFLRAGFTDVSERGRRHVVRRRL